jgi:hypothetical protein
MKDFPQIEGIFEIHMFRASFARETHVRLVDYEKFKLSEPEAAVRRETQSRSQWKLDLLEAY